MDKTRTCGVPGYVLDHVRRCLDALREARERIKPWAGFEGGRYECDAFEANSGLILRGTEGLDRFRRLAADRGVDAEAVIAGLGGDVRLIPSEAAVRYATDDGTRALPAEMAALLREEA